jgi:hypothetical protein
MDGYGFVISHELASNVFVDERGVRFAFRLRQAMLQSLDDYIEESLLVEVSSGKLDRWNTILDRYVQTQSMSVVTTIIPDKLLFFVHPNVSFEEYLNEWKHCLDHALEEPALYQTKPLRKKAYARVGLMGNPSDGFYGTYTLQKAKLL